MRFLRNIDIYSSASVNLGPLYVERVLDCLIGQTKHIRLVFVQDPERYRLYIDYLKSIDQKGNRGRTGIYFYLAHFSQRLGLNEGALEFYERYLRISRRTDESQYYTLWQTGLLRETLGYAWDRVEASLLDAHAADLCRGESIQKLIRHYVDRRNWPVAYSFSYIAVRQFFDRNPISLRRWFVDFDAYNWKVLDSHFRICYKLQYHQEAAETYERMLRYKQKHLDDLQNTEIRQMNSLAKIVVRPRQQFVSDKI